MNKIMLFISAILFFFLITDINAQVTNYGTNSGTGGTSSSYFGISTGKISTAPGNTFLGHAAGADNTTGSYNTFTGANAGRFNTEGSYNVFNGYKAGYQNTTGSHNVFLGIGAGHSNTTAKYNTFLGSSTGYLNTEGEYNVFIGYGAGYDNNTGTANVFMGHVAGRYNTASYNTFIGHATGFQNTTGTENVFNGFKAGNNNTTGTANTFVGNEAGKSNVTGRKNVLIGYESGKNVLGDRNICIGYRAGKAEQGSNKLYIDNDYYNEGDDTVADAPLIYGDFVTHQLGINTQNIPSDYAMAVKGKIITEEVRVKNSNNWPDYVFSNEYDLLPIQDLETFISQKQHLPDVPSAKEVKAQGGSDIGEMNKILLKKVEELTLYIIQLNKEIEAVKKK